MGIMHDWRLNKQRVRDSSAVSMTTGQRQASVLPKGKLVFDSDEGVVYYGDGETLGGVPLNTADLEERVETLEDAVAILDAGGKLVMGSYFCPDWTDFVSEAVMFGAWSNSTAS